MALTKASKFFSERRDSSTQPGTREQSAFNMNSLMMTKSTIYKSPVTQTEDGQNTIYIN